jgi:hypothetical protein
MAENKELNMLEEYLKEFLVEEHRSNHVERETFNIFKYRGLKLSIDKTSRTQEPFFKVQIGMFEASFSIDSGSKIAGGLGSEDEGLIKKWVEFSGNRTLLKLVWSGFEAENYLKIKPFDMD